MLQDKLQFVKSLWSCTRGPLTYKGEPLSDRDRKVSKDGILLWLSVVRSCVEMDDVKEGRLKVLSRSVMECDLFDFLSGLGACDTWLISSVADRSLRNDTALKAVIKDTKSAAEPLRTVKSLLCTHLRRWMDHSDTSAWRSCHQVFAYLSRLNLEKDDLERVAREKWYEAEDRLDEGHLGPTPLERAIFLSWFPKENEGLIYSYMNPHHSSGSTYEGVSAPGEKAMLNGIDPNLEEFLWIAGWHDVLDCDKLQSLFPRIAPGRLACTNVPANLYWECDSGREMLIRHPALVGVRHRVIFVPKNWKTYRTVSMEPVAYMFWQQAVNSALQTYLKEQHARALSHMYCVNTESNNRALALLGSQSGEIATVDMSMASDLVSWDYVAALVKDSALEVICERLRTKYAEMPPDPDLCDMPCKGYETRLESSVHEVKKFAPMGSALCFMLETIVFSTVLYATFLERRKMCQTGWVRSKYLSVYGDDAVMPSELAEPFMQRLSAIGHVPNADKSFFNRNDTSSDFFRESCGGEYLNGEDVTAVRISRKFRGLLDRSVELHSPGTAKAIASLIELANDLYDLSAARYLVVFNLITVGKVPVLFDDTGERGLRSSCPTNFHLERRWNTDLQREEVKAVSLSVVPKWVYYRSHRQYRRAGVFDDFVYTSSYDECPGEVRLFEYLRQARFSRRDRLLYPEDLLSERLDPYSSECVATLHWVVTPTSTDTDGKVSSDISSTLTR